jgi:uroporphyrinogen-III synthase
MGAETLAGRRVVITRAAARADGLVERLCALGAEPIVCPVIAHAPPEDLAAFDAALHRLCAGHYDWLVLTSVTAVEALADRVQQLNNKVELPPTQQIAVVGPATATACAERLGRSPVLMPERFDADAVADALGDVCGQFVLLANADLARDTLQRRLHEAGALVERVIAYRTVPALVGEVDIHRMIVKAEVDAVLFTSSSTVRFFLARLHADALTALHGVALVCIGPSTAATLREAGYTPMIAPEATEAGLVEALLIEPQGA